MLQTTCNTELENKQDSLERIIDFKKIVLLEKQKAVLQNRLWEERRRKKIADGKNINIVFLCSRPTNWGSLKTVCEAFIQDPKCEVKIVAIPEKEPQPELIYEHNIFSDLGAYAHFKNTMDCEVIDGYDRANDSWLNLEKLNPDYMFIQTPYNGLRPEQYHSSRIAAYSKICYAAYGTMLFSGYIHKIALPQDFFGDVSLHFYESKYQESYLDPYYAATTTYRRAKHILSGFARFDGIKENEGKESPVWSHPRSGKLRVLWTPRWTTAGNDSHFLDYKDNFFDLCDNDDQLDFVFRPHPLTFKQVVASEHMSQQELDKYVNSYQIRSNMQIDTRPVYLDTFFSSDILITDISSILPEHLATGKPIIYCHKQDNFNEIGHELAKSFYWANSWDEVTKFVQMLKNGIDPLRESRKEVLSNIYHMPPDGSGNFIKNCVTSHFYMER